MNFGSNECIVGLKPAYYLKLVWSMWCPKISSSRSLYMKKFMELFHIYVMLHYTFKRKLQYVGHKWVMSGLFCGSVGQMGQQVWSTFTTLVPNILLLIIRAASYKYSSYILREPGQRRIWDLFTLINSLNLKHGLLANPIIQRNDTHWPLITCITNPTIYAITNFLALINPFQYSIPLILDSL